MTVVEPQLEQTTHRYSPIALSGIVILAAVGLAPLFYFSMLLALSIDEYQRYTASIPEHGERAAAGADEALFGIGVSLVLMGAVWLLVTGIAGLVAAAARVPVGRTVLFGGGALLVAAALFLLFGLTYGLSLPSSTALPITLETPIELHS